MRESKTDRLKKIPLAAKLSAAVIIILYGTYLGSNIAKGNFIRLEMIAGIGGIFAAIFALWLIKRLPKWAANTITGLMLAYVITFAAFTAAVMSYGISSRSDGSIPSGDGSDIAVVVLGCRTYETPGQMLVKRLISGAEVMDALPQSVGIMCGGQGPNEPVSEASAMCAWMERRGISSDRLYAEDKSGDTIENIANMAAMLEDVPELRGRSLVVVTSDFHLLRARFLLTRQGFDEGSFVMRAGIASDPITTTANLVREYMSWAVLLLKTAMRSI